MQAANRLLEIEEKFGADVRRIVPVELDGTALRIILYLNYGSNLRVTEQWEAGRSYATVITASHPTTA